MAVTNDIIDFVQGLAGHKLNVDEGMRFGDVKRQISGVTICWAADAEAIESAGQKHHNLIICHEALTLPYPGLTKCEQRQYLAWPTNAQRIGLLCKHNIAVCRMHGTLDELFIYDAFSRQIGTTGVVAEVADIEPGQFDSFAKIHSIGPVRYAELIEKVKACTNMPAVRATAGDADRIIKTVGLPWGGLGLSININFMQSIIDLGEVDVMICGETDNYAIRFCKEIGIDVIETSHEVSENKGLAEFSRELKKQFADIDIAFYENPCVWQIF